MIAFYFISCNKLVPLKRFLSQIAISCWSLCPERTFYAAQVSHKLFFTFLQGQASYDEWFCLFFVKTNFYVTQGEIWIELVRCNIGLFRNCWWFLISIMCIYKVFCITKNFPVNMTSCFSCFSLGDFDILLKSSCNHIFKITSNTVNFRSCKSWFNFWAIFLKFSLFLMWYFCWNHESYHNFWCWCKSYVYMWLFVV